ncbi:ABC transporter permease [Pedobacter cryoconitis]|uniref:Putative ABC transport system permease protein n=1 Tax=Pedobacter cryoconitis TaxID=188932 RepID=A0A7X0J4I2_9SPHI|nr:ABC transporter permease [Pedobacter cryoconitis]MBB6500905.1 putative ABC transport system permease protein [Pedobacter cryoconitis]
MTYTENVRLALESIKSNRLRTMLTALIIAIGLTALVGILTTLDAVKTSMTEAFSNMGANSFTIRNKGTGIRIGGPGQDGNTSKAIRYDDAIAFKKQFNTPALVTVSVSASGASTAKYKQVKTNPNINVKGIDENGLKSQGSELSDGRNFTAAESENGSNLCIIGSEIATNLFKKESPIDKFIIAAGTRLKVVGVLASKGSSMGFSTDRAIFIPLYKAKIINTNPNPSYTITVMANSADQLENLIGEATAQFRNVRKIKIREPNNFEISKSDAIAQTLFENLSFIAIGGVAIGVITLIGASIGLMNIMLVSVTERTREIGVRKAIGANPAVIRKQFLIEAVVICLMGGGMGILFGILLGNAISLMMGGAFIIPWLFIFGGFVLCVMVGVLSGYYPAKKASRLDPVEALRYE